MLWLYNRDHIGCYVRDWDCIADCLGEFIWVVYGAGLGVGVLQFAVVGLGPRTFQGYFSKLRAAHANANTMDARRITEY